MVRIVNGEIVPDELTPKMSEHVSNGSYVAPAEPISRPVFPRFNSVNQNDVTSDAVDSRQVRIGNGQAPSLFGFKDITLWNFTFTPIQYLVGAALVFFFGWNGLIGAILLYLLSRRMPNMNAAGENLSSQSVNGGSWRNQAAEPTNPPRNSNFQAKKKGLHGLGGVID